MRALSVLAMVAAGWAAYSDAVAAPSAAPSPYDPEAAIAYSQAAIGSSLPDLGFVDTDGQPVDLATFRGRPLVVNAVYTSCNSTCPLIVQALARAVAVADDTIGADAYTVLTIGFDTRVDQPARMRAFARQQGVAAPNWHFLSATPAAIDTLTETLGFIYFPSPRGYDHLAQTTVLDGDGVIYRQVYGDMFEPPALVEPLMELALGGDRPVLSVAGIVDRVRLFCTFYDASQDRYRFDYSLFIGMTIALAALGGIAVVLIRAWRRAPRPPAAT